MSDFSVAFADFCEGDFVVFLMYCAAGGWRAWRGGEENVLCEVEGCAVEPMRDFVHGNACINNLEESMWCKITLIDKITIFERNEVVKHDCRGEMEHKLVLIEMSLK